MIAGDTWGYFVGIGDAVGEFYFEAVVVETVWISIGHFREFKVVGGDDASNGQLLDKLYEESRAIELVKRVGAF